MYREFHRENVSNGLDDITFPVIKVPVVALHGQSAIPTGKIALIDERNDNVIAVHTEDYKLIPNSEVINKLNPFIDNGFMISKITNYGNKQFRFELENPDFTFQFVEECHPRIVVENSYDGALAFKASAGFIVKVCSNGAIAPKTMFSAYQKHFMTNNDQFNGFDGQILFEALEKMSVRQWDSLESQDIDGYTKKLTKGIADRKDTPSIAQLLLTDRYHKEKTISPSSPDEFSMFMAATYMSTHGNVKHGLPYAQIRQIEKNVTEVFFGR